MPHTLIMTDSTCDLPAAWVQRLDIRVVPTYVQFGTESLADDGVQLTRSNFYDRLIASSTLPTTAAPPLGETVQVMAQALQDADHVVAIAVSSSLSGVFNTFRLACEHTDPRRVTLIDGRAISMGLGWQVLIAAEMAQAGASPLEIENRVLDVQKRVRTWAALDTMEYLRRSGRVGWAAAMVGTIFQIKPVISVEDGIVHSLARVRTSHRAFEMLVSLAQQAAPLEHLAILHTHYLSGALQLLNALGSILPEIEVAVVDVTPVIGVHVGPRGLGIAVVKQASAE